MLSSLGGTLGSGISIQDTYGEGFAKELGMLLRDGNNHLQNLREASSNLLEASNDRQGELNLYRSGSAPPTVHGSLAAVGGLYGNNGLDPNLDLKLENGFGPEDDIRSNPAYLEYYYSHVNLNPRLPPPFLSREDSRLAHRLQQTGHGGIGDRRKVRGFGDGGSKSLFSTQPMLPTHKEENESSEGEKMSPRGGLFRQSSAGWLEGGDDGLIGLTTRGLGSRRKSFADVLQVFYFYLDLL